ncbi:ral guanine nucleotide dissociation stimulator-like 1 [Uloborus diversus]|uniref:ral guanine nucleotide dissociation stimulator-like 1 n=1 Tax=Uloborus diversus TaxID=327109 RepID=UPI00240A81D4|nr:ral guanine nucleotide dissociation stimulator-like 1 [Uloborus diversus]
MNPFIDGSQPSLKLWGEEETDGAVYYVYLKKVRYHHATVDYSDQVSHLEWETVRVKMVKAGTLEKLVESLTTDSGELESTYMNIFLSTYRSFSTPDQVLSLLLKRYEQMHEDNMDLSPETKEQLKQTLEKVLLVWFDMYPEDFYEPPQFLTLLKVKEFASKYVPGSLLDVRAKHRFFKYNNNEYEENGSSGFLDATIGKRRYSFRTFNFLDIPEKDFALQLTYVDNELFKRLIPHHCLGSVWSRRDKARGWSVTPSTVTATVNQFNAVSLRVISTILSDLSLKPILRSKIIVKWVNIAQDLRLLKNFSSLKAITAALQSNSVHRLTKTWLSVPRDRIEIFTELAKIFSEENNQTNCRNLLIKEGSAKFVDTLCSNNKQFHKGVDKSSQENTYTMQGTIPYLGTFLTDLTMIDVAIPDYYPNGLINFDKRRKEFEILAQIKLLQSAANNYDIQEDVEFQEWFSSIQVFDEKESYELSCLIEPQESIPNRKHMLDTVKSSVFKWGHQKSDSSSSAGSSNGFFSEKNCSESNVANCIKETNVKASKSYSCLSLSHLSANPMLNGTCNSSQEFYIIKVSLEQNQSDTGGINMYKSIMLNNCDRTRSVITCAMAKYGIDGDPEEYCLAQVLPEGEIVIPDSTNVYYAVNPAPDLKFILRRKHKTDSSRRKKKLLF